MEITGWIIVRTIMGYELRASRHSEQFAYRSSGFEGVLQYLRNSGYPEPPYEIPSSSSVSDQIMSTPELEKLIRYAETATRSR